MRQNIAVLLPVLAAFLGFYAVIESFPTDNFVRLGFGVILIFASLYVFKRNVMIADTDLAEQIKQRLKNTDE